MILLWIYLGFCLIVATFGTLFLIFPVVERLRWTIDDFYFQTKLGRFVAISAIFLVHVLFAPWVLRVLMNSLNRTLYIETMIQEVERRYAK